MKKFSKYPMFFGSALLIVYVAALSPYAAIKQKCMNYYNLKNSDFVRLKTFGSFPDSVSEDATCFFYCVAKKANFIDQSGYVIPTAIRRLARMNPNDTELVFLGRKDIVKACTKKANEADNFCDMSYNYATCAMDMVSTYEWLPELNEEHFYA